MHSSSNFHYPIRTTDTVYNGQHFFIHLQESPYDNCTWEPLLPSQITVVNTKRFFGEPADTREWELSINQPGQYTLIFNYRKQCCGRRVLKTIQYTVTVI